MELLCIDACISVNAPSRTKTLCDHYLAQYDSPAWHMTRLPLEDLPLSPVTTADLADRMEQGEPELRLRLAKQFQAADRIVIAAPYWDLSFPSILRVYMEQVMTAGVTFRYTETGAVGLCRADKLVYITSAGGFVTGQNFGFDYLAAVGKMVGIPKAQCFCAQGLDIDGVDVADVLHRTMEAMDTQPEAPVVLVAP